MEITTSSYMLETRGTWLDIHYNVGGPIAWRMWYCQCGKANPEKRINVDGVYKCPSCGVEVPKPE